MGLTVTDLKDARRLYEALVIKLTPTHLDGCEQPNSCTCPYVGTALAGRMVARHAPASTDAMSPCPRHRDNSVLLTVPGFRCEDCTVAVNLQCQACAEVWPCEDVKAARDAYAFTTPDKVDQFLADLRAAS